MTVAEAFAVLEDEGIEVKYTYGNYGPVTALSTDPAAGERVGRDGVSFDLADVTVTKVVDGDTLVLSTGDRVLLIGIDAPELGRCGGVKATKFLTDMVKGRAVAVDNPLEVEDRDVHGRLLAYVGVPGHVNDMGYQLVIEGLAVPRYDSSDGYGPHPSEATYAKGAEGATPFRCEPAREPVPVQQPVNPRWACSYSPTYDRDWHNDVLCTNGVDVERPYLRGWDSFVTQIEIMESAREYERQLNRR